MPAGVLFLGKVQLDPDQAELLRAWDALSIEGRQAYLYILKCLVRGERAIAAERCPVKETHDGIFFVNGEPIELSPSAAVAVRCLIRMYPMGLSGSELDDLCQQAESAKILKRLAEGSPWKEIIHCPGIKNAGGYRLVQNPALFRTNDAKNTTST